jgi:hypothetical protein
MTGSQKKQFRQRFGWHHYPVKTFRGAPTRPAYTLYSLWDYPTYLAATNELDELLEQWPCNQPRVLALLAVHAAFIENGATHWAEQLVWDEDQANVHALMLRERQQVRRLDPIQAARHAQHLVQAKAALIESQRRKQDLPSGKRLPQLPQGPRNAKVLVLTPAKPLPNNRPATRPRYTAAQLQRDPLAYQTSVDELDALLAHWPYKRNRIVYLLTVHEVLAQQEGFLKKDSQLLLSGNQAHYTDRHQQARREARAYLPVPNAKP